MMRPEQFTMWLRGVLDSNGQGERMLDREVASIVYEKLSEVVAGQVANRLAEAAKQADYPPSGVLTGRTIFGTLPIGHGSSTGMITSTTSDSTALQIAQLNAQTTMEVEKMRAEVAMASGTSSYYTGS